MRYLSTILLLTALTACQTTAPSQDTPATTGVSTSKYSPPPTGRHVEKINPLNVATELTYDQETKQALTAGTFTIYDPSTLAALEEIPPSFEHPGTALLYLKFFREIKDVQAKKRMTAKYEALKNGPGKNEPGMSRSHRAFMTKVHHRIVTITPKEEEMATLCMAQYTWSYLPENQRSTYDKIALGLAVSPEEVKALKVQAIGRSSEIMPVKCVLEQMELYDRFKKLFLH